MTNPTAKHMAEAKTLMEYREGMGRDYDGDLTESGRDEFTGVIAQFLATAAREAREQALEEVKETAQVLFAPGLSTAICAMCDALKQQSGE